MAEQFDRLLNQKEVAEWLGMSIAWMEMSRFRGVGIPYVKIGRACRYRTSDVKSWIDSHVVGSGI
jgi:predicted DNA-binding transcriptional regulator AlpA